MDEQRLIAALKNGDAAAAQELVDSCGNRLLRSAYLLCGNENDAQDLVQETFLQALKSIHRFRGGSTVYTWLHAVLLNLSRHYHRDRKRLVSNDGEQPPEELVLPDENPDPSDTELAFSVLASALHRLSEAHREAIVLRFYENLKITEIAERLGLSRGTVKSRLHYAIAELQKVFPPEMNLFGAGGTKQTEQR